MSCLRSLSMPTQSVVGRRPLRKQLKHIFGYIYTCFFFCHYKKLSAIVAWENSRHLATPPLISFCFNQSEALLRFGYYGISAHDSQERFRGETSGGVAKCRLFSQATLKRIEKKMRYSMNATSQIWTRSFTHNEHGTGAIDRGVLVRYIP